MTDHPPSFRLDEPLRDERRRRDGVSGMVLAELRELAGTLGVRDTTGMRRGDLVREIKKRQGQNFAEPAVDPQQPETPVEKPARLRASRRRDVANVEESVDADGDVRVDESTVVVTDPETDHERSASDAAPEYDEDPDGAAPVEPLVAVDVPNAPGHPPPPRARFLLAAAVLLAPGERENWRAELETERWDLRGNPRACRRASRSHLRHLLGAAWTSWRHGGHGAAAELR